MAGNLYVFQPYDVLQIFTITSHRGWEDYCSLRTENDGRMAISKVNSALCSQEWRIVRAGEVVYSR